MIIKFGKCEIMQKNYWQRKFTNNIIDKNR